MSLTPPAVKTKNDNVADLGKAKAEKAEKAPKAVKAPKVVDPNAPKKDRAQRKDYGFAKDAIIRLKPEYESKFRGQRGLWFARLKESDGKTVQHFMDNNQGVTNNKGNPEPPRGWLRSFIESEACTLEGGTKAAPAVEAPAADTAAPTAI